MISYKGPWRLIKGHLSQVDRQAQAISGVSWVWPLKALLEVEAGLGLGHRHRAPDRPRFGIRRSRGCSWSPSGRAVVRDIPVDLPKA